MTLEHIAYRDLNSDPRIYQSSLALILGKRAATDAEKRKATPKLARLDLSLVEPLISRASSAVLAVINESVPNARHPDNRDRDLYPNRPDYKQCADKRLCENHDRVMTYTRALQLLEAGHLDSVEAAIADAVLFRAETTQKWPEPLNDTGLAKLDMVLRDAAKAIKPLLLKQGSLLQ